MKSVVKLSGSDFDQISTSKTIIVATIRKSRIKSRRLAIWEMLCVLSPYSAQYILNGPMSDIKGNIAFLINANIDDLDTILAHVGYSDKFWICDFTNITSKTTCYKWKKRPFILKELYCENPEVYRSQSADKRPFKLLCKNGEVKTIKGYRGDGTITGRRALPVEDCRLLSNITCCNGSNIFLDPFAGAGGIVFQVVNNYPRISSYSVDISPDVSYGLRDYGSIHYIGNAADYSPNCSFDAISTEVPFSDSTTSDICRTFKALYPHSSANCRIAIMCANSQVNSIINALSLGGYNVAPSISLNRKGTDVDIILAFKNNDNYLKYMEYYHSVNVIIEFVNKDQVENTEL